MYVNHNRNENDNYRLTIIIVTIVHTVCTLVNTNGKCMKRYGHLRRTQYAKLWKFLLRRLSLALAHNSKL